MRGVFALFAIAVWVSAVAAQPPEVEWIRQFDFGTNQEVVNQSFADIVVVPSGILFAGTRREYGQISDTSFYWTLIETDLAGDTLWTRSYQPRGELHRILQLADGGYALAGEWFSILRLTAAGDSLWYRYDSEYQMAGGLYDAAVAPDNGFLLAGNCELGICQEPPNYFQAKLIKMDSEGNVLWRRLYGGTVSDWFRKVDLTAAGGAVLCASSQTLGLLHVDENGDSLTNLPIHDAGYVREVEPGEYVVARSQAGDLGLLRVNETGQIEWQQVYETEPIDYLSGACTTADGGYVVAANRYISPNLYQIMVLRATAEGDSMWSMTIPLDSSAHVKSIMCAPDGGYVLAGSCGTYPHTNFLMIKLEPEQGTTPVAPVSANLQLFQNYPNPFNATTEIRYELSRTERVSMRVMDLLGREVVTLVDQDLSPGSYQVTFDAEALPSGVYIYRLDAGGQREARKLMLLR